MITEKEDALGATMKSARISMDITQGQLAERLGVSERYIMQMENEHKKPSFPLLVRIIRELSIQSDLIFYPEKPSKDSRIEDLVRMLYNCDERAMKVIRATVKAALESQTVE